MILYLKARTNIEDVIVDSIDVRLASGKEIRLMWDESDINRTSFGFQARYKLDKVLDALRATEVQREDSIPPVEDKQTDVDGLGMDASELLIYRFMGYQAERTAIFENEIWLLGVKETGGQNDE